MPCTRRSRSAIPSILALTGLLLSLCLAAQSAQALSNQKTIAPRGFSYALNPLEERLMADAADARKPHDALLNAALVASGVDSTTQLWREQQRFASLVDQLRRSGTVRGTVVQKARAIFEFMHRDVLTGGYHLESTDLRQALDQGRFNCVSASVLFNCLAAEFGLPVCGLEAPGHAMSRLKRPEGALDIETTCPRWFQLLDDPGQQARLLEKTLGAAAAKDRRPLREVSAVEMAAMIYYNRGVELLGQKRFAEAASVNAKALRLDPANRTARGNFLATLNNWAIALGSAGRYAEAAGLLRQGLSIEPSYETFAVNYVHVYQQWVHALTVAGDAAAAEQVARRAADDPYLQRAAL